MATSSITHNFILNSETTVRFVDALEKSQKNYVSMGNPENPYEMKDPDTIKVMARKLSKKYGNASK